MLYLTHTPIKYVGYANMWECHIVSNDGRYYPELGWPVLGHPNAHNVHVFARNSSSARRKVLRLIRKTERKINR